MKWASRSGEEPSRRLLVATLLSISAGIVLVGQIRRPLLSPDDLRGAEVAREMFRTGNYVVPRLAGLPFVEKPPAFPAAVALAYRIAGSPTAPAARAVAAVFALAALGGVFLLGRRILGLEGGAVAVAVLATTSRFCRTAHEVLLDNALLATFAFALYFAWRALDSPTPRERRRASVFCGVALGLSFLVKGFVGPTLFAAGVAAFALLDRRWSILRRLVRPAALVAFLIVVLPWTAAFLGSASPHLIRRFFVDNQLGRALSGYRSNTRPLWFYLADLPGAFAPWVLFLPFCFWSRWRRPATEGADWNQLLLAFALGPFLVLSLAAAKDSVYLLPAYPALALLVAAVLKSCRSACAGRGRVCLASLMVIGTLSAAGALTATGVLGGVKPVLLPAVVLAILVIWLFRSVRRKAWGRTIAGAVAALGLAWVLWFTGPLAAREIRSRTYDPVLHRILAAAGSRQIWLFAPSDGLRGGLGFLRDRTAREAPSPRALVGDLLANLHSVGVAPARKLASRHSEIRRWTRDHGARIQIVARAPLSSSRGLDVFRIVAGEPGVAGGRSLEEAVVR